MAKVTTAFLGCEDGNPIPRQFNPGDEVHGDLAAVAVREGWAEQTDFSDKDDQKIEKPSESKSRKAAPENK